VRGTFVVNATLAVFGILPGPVLEMILRTVWYLLLVQSHRAMTVHTSNSFTGNTRKIGSGHFNPLP
jgi:hypothetical protein